MSGEINQDRRRWLGTAAMTLAGARLGVLRPVRAGLAEPLPENPPDTKRRTTMSFGELKQIDAGVLNVGYAEAGPADGPAVILLHGWPYDIHSFVDVAPLLAAAGYRVIVPHLRGYGTTRFFRQRPCGTAAVGLALDIIALMDALRIDKAISPASTGARARPTSSRRSGRSAARPWSR